MAMPSGSLNGVKGSQMSRQVNCECGYVARGESDDEVIALVLEHVHRDHPDLAGTEGPDDIRGWIEVVA
jgi:predicted small metal-binding protein